MDGAIHVAEVIIDGETFGVGKVEKLFDNPESGEYQVAIDGSQLLMIKENDVHHLTPLTLVLNWTDDPELRR